MALCPAEMTNSKGRIAKVDQCSCSDTAMSAQMPIKAKTNNKKKENYMFWTKKTNIGSNTKPFALGITTNLLLTSKFFETKMLKEWNLISLLSTNKFWNFN